VPYSSFSAARTNKLRGTEPMCRIDCLAKAQILAKKKPMNAWRIIDFSLNNKTS
jgi:hypothetical protein